MTPSNFDAFVATIQALINADLRTMGARARALCKEIVDSLVPDEAINEVEISDLVTWEGEWASELYPLDAIDTGLVIEAVDNVGRLIAVSRLTYAQSLADVEGWIEELPASWLSHALPLPHWGAEPLTPRLARPLTWDRERRIAYVDLGDGVAVRRTYRDLEEACQAEDHMLGLASAAMMAAVKIKYRLSKIARDSNDLAGLARHLDTIELYLLESDIPYQRRDTAAEWAGVAREIAELVSSDGWRLEWVGDEPSRWEVVEADAEEIANATARASL